jgi:hypothetical protein
VASLTVLMDILLCVHCSISAFEPSNLFGLFNYLGVPLLHGWLVNPADKTIYESIRQYSYEGLLKYCNSLEGPEQHSEAPSGAVAQKRENYFQTLYAHMKIMWHVLNGILLTCVQMH